MKWIQLTKTTTTQLFGRITKEDKERLPVRIEAGKNKKLTTMIEVLGNNNCRCRMSGSGTSLTRDPGDTLLPRAMQRRI